MQTEKSQPEGKRIMPETQCTLFPALSVYPCTSFLALSVYPRTSFPALSIYPRVCISQSASETDVRFYLFISCFCSSHLKQNLKGGITVIMCDEVNYGSCTLAFLFLFSRFLCTCSKLYFTLQNNFRDNYAYYCQS